MMVSPLPVSWISNGSLNIDLLLSLVTTGKQQDDFRQDTARRICGRKTYLKNNF
jgi:hypothetical protein